MLGETSNSLSTVAAVDLIYTYVEKKIKRYTSSEEVAVNANTKAPASMFSIKTI